MLLVLNPDKLTRQPFFQDLINYLSENEDVSLRQLKRDFLRVSCLERSLEDYIQAGYILRQNKRYYLTLSLLEDVEGVTLDQQLILDTESPVYQDLQALVFETRLTNKTNEAVLIERTDFERNAPTLSNYFYKMRTGASLTQKQGQIYNILGDVNPDYALKYMTSFLLKFAKRDLVKQRRSDIFVEVLVLLGYIKEEESATYSLQLAFDEEKLSFKEQD